MSALSSLRSLSNDTGCDGHLDAARFTVCFGKTLEKDADLNSERAQQLRSQAVILLPDCYSASSNQHHASNQLGYALIHLDGIEEAYDALRASIEVKPNAPAWTNISRIISSPWSNHRSQYAVTASYGSRWRRAEEQLDITQVDPAVFAKFSCLITPIVLPHRGFARHQSGAAYQQTAKG